MPVWTGCWGASDRTPLDAFGAQNASLEPLCSALEAEASASGAALCCVRCVVLQRELSIDRTLARRQVLLHLRIRCAVFWHGAIQVTFTIERTRFKR
jgi:hypothetical protein